MEHQKHKSIRGRQKLQLHQQNNSRNPILHPKRLRKTNKLHRNHHHTIRPHNKTTNTNQPNTKHPKTRSRQTRRNDPK